MRLSPSKAAAEGDSYTPDPGRIEAVHQQSLRSRKEWARGDRVTCDYDTYLKHGTVISSLDTGSCVCVTVKMDSGQTLKVEASRVLVYRGPKPEAKKPAPKRRAK